MLSGLHVGRDGPIGMLIILLICDYFVWFGHRINSVIVVYLRRFFTLNLALDKDPHLLSFSLPRDILIINSDLL